VPNQTVVPASPLAPFFSEAPLRSQLVPKEPRLILVTGPSGCGKTTRCRHVAERARALGLTVEGFLSLPCWHAGRKIGIDLFELSTQMQKRLAEPRGDISDGLTYGRWLFHPETISWANDLTDRWPVSDCLIFDELGPLEFSYGRGLLAAMSLIDLRQASWTLLTVRPSLLEMAKARWPWAEEDTVSCEQEASRPS